jgi:hypothetical protein
VRVRRAVPRMSAVALAAGHDWLWACADCGAPNAVSCTIAAAWPFGLVGAPDERRV